MLLAEAGADHYDLEGDRSQNQWSRVEYGRMHQDGIRDNLFRMLLLSLVKPASKRAILLRQVFTYVFLTYSLTSSFTYSVTHSVTHSRTHSFTHSLTQSLTNSLTPSLPPSLPSILPHYVCIAPGSPTSPRHEGDHSVREEGFKWGLHFQQKR